MPPCAELALEAVAVGEARRRGGSRDVAHLAFPPGRPIAPHQRGEAWIGVQHGSELGPEAEPRRQHGPVGDRALDATRTPIVLAEGGVDRRREELDST